MKICKYLCWLVLIFLLAGCDLGVPAPQATGVASPAAVALSLSTVDPQDSLHLFVYDQTAPLDIQEDRRWHQEDATWIDFTYASPKGGRVPARLVIPDGKGPFPGIILQHGGPGVLEEMVDFARAFARYGAATIMITSPYRRPGGWEITQYMGNTWPIFTDRDIEIKIQTINDLQRAVDILVERPEIDPHRLAYFGVSWGGSMGGLLAGVEDRLVAYVLAAGDGGLVEHTADPGEDGLNLHFSEDWAARMWSTEPLHFVGRAAPAALLFQNGLQDTFVPPHDALRFFTAASEPKTMIWYDAGHNLPWSFVADAAQWLQPYLGDRLFFSAPDYRPSAVTTERAIMGAVLLSITVFLLDEFRKKNLNWGGRLVWLLGMIILGPLGLLLYWLARRNVPDPVEPVLHLPRWRQTFEITIDTTLTLTIGLFVGNRINSAFTNADFRLRFLQQYLAILIFAWLLRLLITRPRALSTYRQLLASNLFWVVVMFYPLLLHQLGITIPIYLDYILAFLLGILVIYPWLAWMLTRDQDGWGSSSALDALSTKKRWLVIGVGLLFSYLSVFLSVMVVVQVYTGFSWREVFLVIIGRF